MHRGMKTMGCGDKASRIRDLDVKWRWMVCLTVWKRYSKRLRRVHSEAELFGLIFLRRKTVNIHSYVCVFEHATYCPFP
jgi:hypothetical protein